MIKVTRSSAERIPLSHQQEGDGEALEEHPLWSRVQQAQHIVPL